MKGLPDSNSHPSWRKKSVYIKIMKCVFSHLPFNNAWRRLLNNQYPDFLVQILVYPLLRVIHQVLLVLDSSWLGRRNAQILLLPLFSSFHGKWDTQRHFISNHNSTVRPSTEASGSLEPNLRFIETSSLSLNQKPPHQSGS